MNRQELRDQLRKNERLFKIAFVITLSYIGFMSTYLVTPYFPNEWLQNEQGRLSYSLLLGFLSALLTIYMLFVKPKNKLMDEWEKENLNR